MGIIEHIVFAFLRSAIKYVIFAGVAYLIFYIWKKEKYFRLKIQSKYPDSKNIRREITDSFLSISVFAVVGGLLFWLRSQGYTKVYLDFHTHSVAYFLFTVALFILAHDTYFYWTHRFMHWDKVYKYVHRTHHLSTNPTPWAAFAFHPLEALIEIGILPIMLFLVPLHPAAILIWAVYMTTLNVMGHVGFEIFPSGFTTNKITRWHNSSVHHNMHHRYVRCNYGLYYNIWDRMMGTNHEKYDEEFEAVKQRPAIQAESYRQEAPANA
jgi:sterol desaturase/sphingolipid hydroxylase (fatty acid hydroxylase superfamily)